MINIVSKFIDKKLLCQRDDKLLIAISGGADSVALFLCLKEAQRISIMADQHILGLLVVFQCHLVGFSTDA